MTYPARMRRPNVVIGLLLALLPGACATRPPTAVPPEVTTEHAARTRACQALSAQDAKVTAELEAELTANGIDVIDYAHDSLGVCVAARGGAWVLVMSAGNVQADPELENGGPRLDLAIDLYFVADDGRATLATSLPGLGEELRTITPSIDAVFDWDDDGLPEVAILESDDQPDFHTKQTSFYRTTGNAVVEWKPVPALATASIEDVDDDGRPDLVDDQAFVQDIMAPMFVVSPGYGRLYHSLPGGRFASDDAACKAYYRAQCPAPVALSDITTDETDEALRLAMCAAMYGGDIAKLEARLDEVYATAFSFMADMDQPPVTTSTLRVPMRLP